jgi:hypothetical protein
MSHQKPKELVRLFGLFIFFFQNPFFPGRLNTRSLLSIKPHCTSKNCEENTQFYETFKKLRRKMSLFD